jgi:hypothetical protein
MIKAVIRIVGMLIALGGAAAGWFGVETTDEIRGLENEITVQTAAIARAKGNAPKAKAKITECEQEIEAKRTQRNFRWGVAVGALIVGLGMAIGPSVERRKPRAARPAPEKDQAAAAAAPAATPAPQPSQETPGL